MKNSYRRLSDYMVLLCFIVIPALLSSGVTYYLTRDTYVPLGTFNDRIAEINETNAYEFLPTEMSEYILKLCKEVDMDPDLVVSILLNENPMLDVAAMNRNNNNSVDLGLFQLNDKYLYSTFQKRYWKFKDVELNPFNWKHNTYIAINHLKHLTKTHKIWDEVVMAYNCGSNAVMNNKVPETTKVYLARAKKNYSLLKNQVKYDLDTPEIVIEEDSNLALAKRD